MRDLDLVHLPIDLAAGALLAVFATSGIVAALRRLRALTGAYRMARRCQDGGDLTVIEDDRPLAHALPGRPGRIVVSTSMLAVLRPAERRALLAHEQAHLDHRHHLFVAVIDVLAAANPLLRPLTGTIRFTTERWADEIAAGQVGDRAVVARAVGRAALASRAPSGRAAGAAAVVGAAVTAGAVHGDGAGSGRRIGTVRRGRGLRSAPRADGGQGLGAQCRQYEIGDLVAQIGCRLRAVGAIPDR
jgi:hypothetical protein